MGVAVHSYQYEDLQNINDLSKTLLSQVEEFFISYNKQRDKNSGSQGRAVPKRQSNPSKLESNNERRRRNNPLSAPS